MKASEFALKNKFNSTDTRIVNALYGKEEKKEQEWFLLMKGKINFDHSPYESTAKPSSGKEKKVVEKVIEPKK